MPRRQLVAGHEIRGERSCSPAIAGRVCILAIRQSNEVKSNLKREKRVTSRSKTAN